jgi:hypothetical protein
MTGKQRTIAKAITYFGKPCVVACDANCDKAWGIWQRPRVQISADPDDYAFRADAELGTAPTDAGTYEGDDAKPLTRPMTGELMNRWCVRQCERSVVFDGSLPDLSQRLYNIPASGRAAIRGAEPPIAPNAAPIVPTRGAAGEGEQ